MTQTASTQREVFRGSAAYVYVTQCPVGGPGRFQVQAVDGATVYTETGDLTPAEVKEVVAEWLEFLPGAIVSTDA